MTSGHPLDLREQDGELRYLLGDWSLRTGDSLEMLLGTGEWLAVRFEWPVDDELPTLRLELGATKDTVTFRLPEGARFRRRERE